MRRPQSRGVLIDKGGPCGKFSGELDAPLFSGFELQQIYY